MSSKEAKAFVVIGPNCWGKADTFEQALKNAKKELPGSWLISSARRRAGITFQVLAIDCPLEDVRIRADVGCEVLYPKTATAMRFTHLVKMR